MRKDRTRYYREFTDDFVTSKDQNTKVPSDYEYIRESFSERFRSGLTYGLAIVLGYVYCKLILRVRFVNRRAFSATKGQGAFIYANHTQPVGDVVLPAFACFPRRIYTVVSPANLGIPFIGRQLPYLGALPIADTAGGMKRFTSAMEHRLSQKKIITIYPEAHVWEYHKDIRPYSDASFRYPVKFNAPVFCLTVTYQQSRVFRRPRTTVYVDGPFYPDTTLPPRARAAKLHSSIYECMCQRSKNSTCEYIRYRRAEAGEETSVS